MTNVKIPSAPASVEIADMTDSSLSISWTLPESSNGVIISYRVTLSIVQSYNKHQKSVTDKVLQLSSSSTVTRVGDLLSGTFYNISVQVGVIVCN